MSDGQKKFGDVKQVRHRRSKEKDEPTEIQRQKDIQSLKEGCLIFAVILVLVLLIAFVVWVLRLENIARASTSAASRTQAGVAWLKKRGVLAENPQLQALQFGWLQNPSSAPSATVAHYQRCQDRLLRLLQPNGEIHLDAPPKDAHQFQPDEFPGFDVPLIVNDATRVQRYLQKSSLCYMHGPAVVQHYRISVSSLKTNSSAQPTHQMLDLVGYIHDTFDAARLEKHIFDDEGSNSLQVLENILEPGSVVSASSVSIIAQNLAKFGPGLVAQFKVYDDFMNDDAKRHYSGKPPPGKPRGMHAMALVGARQDGQTGKHHFLLQNWWFKKQFVEVDEEYLKACGATVYFIETDQTKVPEQFPTHSGHWFETETVDKAESYMPDNDVWATSAVWGAGDPRLHQHARL